jgi:hypothetical protein
MTKRATPGFQSYPRVAPRAPLRYRGCLMGQESDGERLAAEKQYFDAVLDRMSDGGLVCDSAMRVTKFNAAIEASRNQAVV